MKGRRSRGGKRERDNTWPTQLFAKHNLKKQWVIVYCTVPLLFKELLESWYIYKGGISSKNILAFSWLRTKFKPEQRIYCSTKLGLLLVDGIYIIQLFSGFESNFFFFFFGSLTGLWILKRWVIYDKLSLFLQ